MNICFIADNPETREHPVIGRVLQELGSVHTVRLADVAGLSGDEAIAKEKTAPLANLYLLKSHTHQALTLAQYLEQRGTLVVNSFASSSACQDRLLMAERMNKSHLAHPRTWSFASLEEMLAQQDFLSDLQRPLMIKSRHSQRGDLVAKVHRTEDMYLLAEKWKQEPVVLQEFVQGDSWDIKVWVIGQEVFAARRRTSLEANPSKQNFPISAEELPVSWRSLSLDVGRAFGLYLYGLDLLVTDRGQPVIVDINSFPGFRGVPAAVPALVSLIKHLLDAPGTGTPKWHRE